MDNLWKKDTAQKHDRYVDLFACIKDDEEWNKSYKTLESLAAPKNNCKSREIRKHGNEAFLMKDWYRAMNLYTQSLCFAEIGTENVALAYANRSACFIHVNGYDEALIDIELARNTNLPAHLIPKLQQREQKCLEFLGMYELQSNSPKLSFKADQNFPCIANVLEIKYTQNFGRHIVTKCDIPAEKIILVEENFAVSSNDFSKCYTCLCNNRNFLACERCTRVVFCSRECMNKNQTHKWECGTILDWLTNLAGNDGKLQHSVNRMRLIVHSVLIALSTFSDVEHLMQFVGSILHEDPDQLPISLHDQISKYRFFLKLKKSMICSLDDVKRVYDCTMSLPKVQALFDTEEKQRFLMHLVANHTYIVDTNAIEGPGYISVNNVFSMFNHSCEPNTETSGWDYGKSECCTTIRPVKKGEQLFISYLSIDQMKMSKEEHGAKIKSRWGFDCKCQKCISTDETINTSMNA